MSDFSHFSGVCPYCDAGPFDDEDVWFEHVAECEQEQTDFMSPEDEDEQ